MPSSKLRSSIFGDGEAESESITVGVAVGDTLALSDRVDAALGAVLGFSEAEIVTLEEADSDGVAVAVALEDELVLGVGTEYGRAEFVKDGLFDAEAELVGVG